MAWQTEDIASFFWLALNRGLLGPKPVIEWADRLIAESAQPGIHVIDLSLTAGKPVDSVMDALRPLFSEFTSGAFRLFAALLHRRVLEASLSEAQAANHLYGLYSRHAEAVSILGDEVRCIDEWFEDWAMGPEKAKVSVRDYLAKFSGEQLPA